MPFRKQKAQQIEKTNDEFEKRSEAMATMNTIDEEKTTMANQRSRPWQISTLATVAVNRRGKSDHDNLSVVVLFLYISFDDEKHILVLSPSH